MSKGSPAPKPGDSLMRDFARLLLMAVVLPVLAIIALLAWQGRDVLLALVVFGLVLAGVLAIVHVKTRQMGRSVQTLLDRIKHFSLDLDPLEGEVATMPRELAPLAEAMDALSVRCHTAYGTVQLGLQEQRRLREQLQAMARRLLTVQEDERRTLSRELHDDIGQAITAIKLGAMALQEEDDRDGEGARRTREILDEIVATTDQTIGKLRNLSVLLRPPQLDTLGLETALRWQAEALFRSGRPQLIVDMVPLSGRPSPDVELACFRIAQEALTNILRHSGARHVTLTLAPEPDGDALRLEIADDGRGFEPGDRQGLGLLTMRERAHQVGGTLETNGGRGVRIRAVLPMQHANHVAVPDIAAQEPPAYGRYSTGMHAGETHADSGRK